MSAERWKPTEVEWKAIIALERLAAKWPGSLALFSASGSLGVIPFGRETETIYEDDVIWINGISNDGGDPDFAHSPFEPKGEGT